MKRKILKVGMYIIAFYSYQGVKQILSKPYLSTENTLAILPMALILFRMTSFRSFA